MRVVVVSAAIGLLACACIGNSTVPNDGAHQSGDATSSDGMSGPTGGPTRDSMADPSDADPLPEDDTSEAGGPDSVTVEPSTRLRDRIERTAPTYERRDFVPGIGVRITYDIASYRVSQGRHVTVRVRSRRFWEDPKLRVASAGVPRPQFQRAGSLQGGFEWVWKIPSVPAGQHRVTFHGDRGEETPTAVGHLFVYADDQGDQLLANPSFERGTATPPTGWQQWADTSGDHRGISLGYRSTQNGESEVVHGERAVRMTSSYATHRAGLYQTVDVGSDRIGCTAEFSVSVLTWSKKKDEDDDCGSGSFRALAGIDPSGGTDAASETVAWSDVWDACPTFGRLRVREPIERPTIAVFLKSAPKWPLQETTSIWDHAKLTVDCAE